MHTLILMTALQFATADSAQAGDHAPVSPQSPARQEDRATRNPDMVLRWNDIFLEVIRKERTPPPVAARNLAIVHVSIYDAVNAIAGVHARYLVDIKPLAGASAQAAAATAAHRALIDLYPGQRALFDKALTQSLAELPDSDGKLFGADFGRFVTERVLAWRSRDGMDQRSAYAPEAAPGVWQRTPPDFADPVLPHWRGVAPFAMRPENPLHPKDPPRLTDAEYTTAFHEVKELGAANSKTRTRDQTEIARFWADGAGTCTPPGHWNQIAQTVARKKHTSLVENARLFALLNIALADAGILCWDCKYKLSFWRPVTGIHHADQDGNPNTQADAAWKPLLDTPPFPSYTSGHSTFSGAAAAVLADVFGDNISFQTTSDGLPGVTRSFKSFWAAAEEAGQSRIYGGIHWQFDNTEGLALGKTLARLVCRDYLVAINPSQK